MAFQGQNAECVTQPQEATDLSPEEIDKIAAAIQEMISREKAEKILKELFNADGVYCGDENCLSLLSSRLLQENPEEMDRIVAAMQEIISQEKTELQKVLEVLNWYLQTLQRRFSNAECVEEIKKQEELTKQANDIVRRLEELDFIEGVSLSLLSQQKKNAMEYEVAMQAVIRRGSERKRREME
jgi:hypothetical protein